MSGYKFTRGGVSNIGGEVTHPVSVPKSKPKNKPKGKSPVVKYIKKHTSMKSARQGAKEHTNNMLWALKQIMTQGAPTKNGKSKPPKSKNKGF